MSESLAELTWLLGEWQGVAEGEPGKGRQVRRYELVLRGEFLMGTNRTVWQPKPGAADGEVHEDLSIISLDRAASQLIMHVFYVERFVATYACDPRGEPNEGVFTADRVQNGAPGMRSRETFVRRADDELESRFELAMADKPFALYTHEILRRTRPRP
jgi:hypothetical protein